MKDKKQTMDQFLTIDNNCISKDDLEEYEQLKDKIIKGVERYVDDQDFKPCVKVNIDCEAIMDLQVMHGLSDKQISETIGELIIKNGQWEEV